MPIAVIRNEFGSKSFIAGGLFTYLCVLFSSSFFTISYFELQLVAVLTVAFTFLPVTRETINIQTHRFIMTIFIAAVLLGVFYFASKYSTFIDLFLKGMIHSEKVSSEKILNDIKYFWLMRMVSFSISCIGCCYVAKSILSWKTIKNNSKQ